MLHQLFASADPEVCFGGAAMRGSSIKIADILSWADTHKAQTESTLPAPQGNGQASKGHAKVSSHEELEADELPAQVPVDPSEQQKALAFLFGMNAAVEALGLDHSPDTVMKVMTLVKEV